MLVGRHLDSVAAMNGRADLRLGITDVAPVVSCGAFSARAVVGEHLPITATVFREGHDAVAANVVWTPPTEAGGGPTPPSGGGGGAPPPFRGGGFGHPPHPRLTTLGPPR